jgi:hypothetical protein
MENGIFLNAIASWTKLLNPFVPGRSLAYRANVSASSAVVPLATLSSISRTLCRSLAGGSWRVLTPAISRPSRIRLTWPSRP